MYSMAMLWQICNANTDSKPRQQQRNQAKNKHSLQNANKREKKKKEAGSKHSKQVTHTQHHIQYPIGNNYQKTNMAEKYLTQKY
mmetsp:Transcript_71348/g.113454  ORF Transcript_71348/g.113454 Transcript_71348/m.113454 type:complete len:84 (-) Transcript_71348:365-616(-)